MTAELVLHLPFRPSRPQERVLLKAPSQLRLTAESPSKYVITHSSSLSMEVACMQWGGAGVQRSSLPLGELKIVIISAPELPASSLPEFTFSLCPVFPVPLSYIYCNQGHFPVSLLSKSSFYHVSREPTSDHSDNDGDDNDDDDSDGGRGWGLWWQWRRKTNCISIALSLIFTSKKNSCDLHNNLWVGRGSSHFQSTNRGAEKHETNGLLLITQSGIRFTANLASWFSFWYHVT